MREALPVWETGVYSDAFAVKTVPEAEAFVSLVKDLDELAEIYSLEANGKNRKGVLAAIDVQGVKLRADRVEPGSATQ